MKCSFYFIFFFGFMDENDPSAGSPTDTLLRLLLLLDGKAGGTLPELTTELPP